MKKVHFYFDFISPYVYLAWTQLSKIQEETSCEFIFKPLLFAGLLNHFGQKGPAEIPAKRIYTMRDSHRLAKSLNVPMEGPPAHPFSPLLSLRLCLAMETEASRQQLAGRILQACWGEGKDITNLNTLQKLLSEIGIQGNHWFEKTQSGDVKEELKKNTQEAIEKGVFGVPTFSIEGELFWGSDRIPLLIDFLKGSYSIDEEKIKKALNRPRAADRKQI